VAGALDSVREMCLYMNTGLEVRHGACRTGADLAAHQWCEKNIATGVTEEPFPADWSTGVNAGPLRNIRMFDNPVDLVLAFWDGRSKGTKHTIDLATKRRILTIVRFS